VDTSSTSSGTIPRGTFQNLCITADAANNSIVVYSNQEDYRVVERALRDIDIVPCDRTVWRRARTLNALLREIPAPAGLRRGWIDGMACR
jgi:hypothetical protein